MITTQAASIRYQGAIDAMLLLRLLLIALLLYAAFGIYLYLAQRSFIYLPVRDEHPGHDNFFRVQSGGESIKVWEVTPGRNKAVIYFGGNAEDVFHALPEFGRFLPDHSSYLVNYRGYGGSSGNPSEQGLFADALAIYEQVRQRHEQVAVIGRSLGSGIAVYLAGRRPVDKLVLVTPPASALAVARTAYPFYPVALLLKDKYESIRYAAQITAPTLLLIAARDEVIPVKHSLTLFDHFPPGTAEKSIFPDAGHNDISSFPEYWEKIVDFLEMP